MTRFVPRLVALFVALLPTAALAQTTAYCTISEVNAQQLSNGVQITVVADGVLSWQPEGGDWGAFYGGTATRLSLRFTNAKTSIARNFIDVSKFPVSYVQLGVPQDAREGVGVVMTVALFDPSTVNVTKSTDQQSLLITVNSNRTLVSRPTNGATSTQPGPTTSQDVTFKDGKLALYAVKSKLAGLLARIARLSGVDMVVDDSVKDREVSMALADVDVDQALQALASAHGLSLSKSATGYAVSDGVPTDLATYRLSDTSSYRMKYIKAQAASGLLPTFLYNFAHVNEAQNAVVVTAPAAMLTKLKDDFTKIDVAPPQIMIEAVAVELASTSDLGASLGLSYEHNAMTGAMDTATGDISYSTIGELPHDFNAKLNALISQGKAQVRATPRMAAINGQAADIFIGQTRFIKVEVASYGVKTERIQGVDVGVKLSVRPWTGGNGEVTVTLIPEVSNISELDRETGMPVLSSRRAETTVRVKDGETVMIGGLTQKQEYRTHNKIPILGDIPILGNLFQSAKTSSIDSELVVFLTPRILTNRGRLADEAAEKAIRDRMQVITPAKP